MSKIGKWDGALLGAALGALIAFPSVITTITNFVSGIIPADWKAYGAWVLPAIYIGVGALIGYIVDKS